MKLLFSIPNLFSLGNLLCGCIATLNIIEANFYPAAILVGVACVFDFLDGFAARGLKQGSPMGKELDSLADLVTFGVVPGMVMFQLIRYGAIQHVDDYSSWMLPYLPYAGFLIPLFSGLRLAKFNVDTRQSESFIGLPTLANAIFIMGIPLALGLNQATFAGYREPAAMSPEDNISWDSYLQREGAYMTDSNSTTDSIFPRLYEAGEPASVRFPLVTPAPASNSFWDFGEHLREGQMQDILHLRETLIQPWLLIGITLLFSILLLSNIPMFSFKIKSLKWKGNEARYVFLGLSAGLVVWLKMMAVPLVIVLYILVSMVNTIEQRKVKGKEKKDKRKG